ncbi:hypothetical protein [Ralstonia solanacearum]|uniref:hypothetical protein n=1 Tax=Ralstonia solanacearum TaxID=305 RepID=UPI0013DE117C|nr:hypothetical protein [Ralstonia solanacearum]
MANRFGAAPSTFIPPLVSFHPFNTSGRTGCRLSDILPSSPAHAANLRKEALPRRQGDTGRQNGGSGHAFRYDRADRVAPARAVRHSARCPDAMLPHICMEKPWDFWQANAF